jgi:oligoendopeptidase F
MFAEFEHGIHRTVEQGGTLTAEKLGETYLESLVTYWGPDAVFDPERSPLTWSRIPHFYYNYYVYQYATAFAASVALSRRVLEGGPAELDAYLGFQRSGCSRYPVDTLRAAGVDMETPGPVDDVFTLFNGLIDEIESLLLQEDE